MSTKQIPQELKDLRQWHNWEDRNGVKIPLQVNRENAKSNDPSTWSDFETAEAFGLLAFEITDPYTGIDLDNCLDAFGELRKWAMPIVARLDGIAYAEISPSGTGIKFLTRARKTPSARCVHKFDGPKQQLECYDHGRFWTITGNVYARNVDIGDGQSSIDWICNEYLLPTVVAARPVILGPVSQTPLTDRAISYLDSVPACGTGGRNNAAFSLAGHLAAMVDDVGNRLSEDQIVNLMQIWNSRNFEPLPDDELARATSSAAKNGTARAEKRPQAIIPYVEDAGVDLSGIMGGPAKRDPEPDDSPGLGLHIPGLIGDLVQHNLNTAHYPLPELALAGALALMASLTGGKIEHRGSRSNVYVMGLAPSGGGKDYSRKLNRKILRGAGHGQVCGPERIGSHAGIVSAMAEQWNTLFQIDEIGRLLSTMQSASMAPHLYNIASVLMQIYSSADDVWQGDAYGDRKKVKVLEYPHCVVYGTSVPDGFWESLSKQNLSDGLIGRFLVFENSEYVDYQDPPEDVSIPQDIIDRARHWLDHRTHSGNLAGVSNHDAAHPQEIDADADATDRLRDHAIEISNRRKSEESVTAAIWSRHAEKTNKIAMLFASSRYGPGESWPIIRLDDADKAIRLNNWLTRRMLKRAGMHISENQTEKEHLKVLRLIQTQSEWTSTELARKMRWLKARDRREILTTLQEAGDIVAEERTTGGRAAIIYRAL